MVRDINFLYDDTHLEKERLDEIVKVVQKKPEKVNQEAVFLRKFILSLYNSAKKKVEQEKKKPIVHKIESVKKVEPRKEIKKPIKKPEPKKEPKLEVPAPIPEYPEYPVIRSSDNTVLVRVALKDHVYSVNEPVLNEQENNLFSMLKEKLSKKLLAKPVLINDSKFILKPLEKFSKKLKIPISKDLYRKIHYFLVRELFDYGKINVLLKDHNIKGISIKSFKDPIIITYNNFNDIKTTIKFNNKEELNNIIKKFFEKANQKLTRDANYLDTNVQGFQVKANYDFDGDSSSLEIKK